MRSFRKGLRRVSVRHSIEPRRTLRLVTPCSVTIGGNFLVSIVVDRDLGGYAEERRVAVPVRGIPGPSDDTRCYVFRSVPDYGVA